MFGWKTLYAVIWLVLLEFLLAMTPNAPGWLTYVHVALGLGIVALAVGNHRAVRASRVPGRVKRTTQSTVQLSVALAVLGGLLALDVGAGVGLAGVTVFGALLFLHVVLGFAVITQAAAVAMAYDMWEEKEFLQETAPGEVPAMPAPAAKPQPRA